MDAGHYTATDSDVTNFMTSSHNAAADGYSKMANMNKQFEAVGFVSDGAHLYSDNLCVDECLHQLQQLKGMCVFLVKYKHTFWSVYTNTNIRVPECILINRIP